MIYNGKKVLIVDDSLFERKVLKDILIPMGFVVIEAENGEDGIQMAIDHEPQLILMDVVMPGINGFQTTKRITNNERLKHVPVIMCTSKNQETDKIWGARQGAKAYVSKPINKDLLIAEIHKLLG